MNILITVGYTYPVLGGTELASFNVAKHLVQQGHNVTIVARHSKDFKPGIIEDVADQPLYEELCDGKLKIHRVKLPLKSKIWKFPIGRRFFAQLWQTFRVAWKHPPDVILSFTLVPTSFLALCVKYLLIVARFKRIPIVAWSRGSDIFVTPKRKDFEGQITRFCMKYVFHANKILAQTHASKLQLIELGCKESKISIIGNAIEIPEKLPVRKPSGNIVLYVGGARPTKGLPYLISAIGNMPHVSLVVVGGWGEEKWVSQALAKSNVKFVGKVAPNEIPKYLQNASVFCLPSLSEGFPNSLLEAMAHGLPIVASNVGGVPSVLGRAGILVEPQNQEQLRIAINKMLQPKIAESYSAQAFKRAHKFTWTHTITQLEAILEDARS